ncbi:hypothetical protein AAFC00_006351 [Neodothiora populina]|uniref:PH domain-containing protein n=1 Tax=Neodothiora populina TaxID=2781224 RepID=A0ABR3P4V9_9PEZI
MASMNMPSRTATNSTDDAIPDEDTSEVTKLFLERLQAWKHACGYLEDYIGATEKVQLAHAKEYEKVLKTVNQPLKEGHQFDQNLGGIAAMFDNIRSNTQAISNIHTETAKTLKGSILPILDRLHTEIKNKNKEIAKGAGKGSKAVDKAQKTTQKHIELLGQHTAGFESHGGRLAAHEDPYIIQRGVYHRLNNQIIEENNNRQDLIAVQNNFSQFEAHVVQTFQTAIDQFNQIIGQQCEQVRNLYSDVALNAQKITPDFEWRGFVSRNANILIDPSAPPRSVENTAFANQNHRATQPLIAGSLERKGKMLKKYDSAFYVVTPAKYLHSFKTDDDFAKDPTPETSLYLPDCIVGAVDGQKFMVKGKDSSKSSIGNKFSMTHEYAFKAHTAQDAQRWADTIRSVAGQSTGEQPGSANISPISSRQASGTMNPPAESQQRTYGNMGSPDVGGEGGAPMTSAEREAAQASQGVHTADKAY